MHYDGWFIRRLPSGAPVWLCCRDDVSVFMGWDKAFEPFWYGKGLHPGQSEVRYYRKKASSSPAWGGSQFRIGRGPRKGVFTPGLTHAFRLRGTWSPRDVRQVMRAVVPDWNWVKFPDGRTREKSLLL